MATIYEGQKLILNYTDTDGKDMSLINFRVDYWKPTNNKGTPDGTIDPGNIIKTTGSSEVMIKISKNILSSPNVRGRGWRFQIIDNDSGIAWPVMTVDVTMLGMEVSNGN